MEALRQVFELLERRERWQLLVLGLSMTGMAVLEALGVASILPFMQVLTNPQIVEENRWLAMVFERGGFETRESFVFFLGIGVMFLIVANNAFSALTIWAMYRFAWSQNHRLSTRLLSKYLDKPYTFFLSRNTAGLSKNILSEVQIVVQGVLLGMLRLVCRLLIVSLIICLLAIVNWRLALLIGLLLGGSYATVYLSLRRRQRQYGQERLIHNEWRFKVASESLSGIKELKILGREKTFLRKFKEPSWRFSRLSASNQVVAALPRYALETIAFSGVLIIVLFLLRTGSGSEILPLISLYVFAGYRLMPSLNEIFTAAVQLRFNRAALDDLHRDLLDVEPGDGAHSRVSASQLSVKEELRVSDLTYTYPGASRPSLQDISLVIRPNQVIGIVGATGAGKTTLVDVLLGLLRPTSGRIEIDGALLTAANLQSWRRTCGYIPQTIFLTDDSIAANIAFGVPTEEIDASAVLRAAIRAQIHDFIEGLPDKYDTVVGERGVRLSGGQRQRIGIARALYHDPTILVLDEATSSLDGATEAAVMEMIHNWGSSKTLIVIAHRLSTVRACDVVYLLREGKLVGSGTLDELVETNEDFRSMAGLVVT